MGDVKESTALELPPIKFNVQVKKDKKEAFVGQRDQKLEDAIRRLDNTGFSITDHILFTDFDIDVIDKVEPNRKVVRAAILPSLLCGWLKESSVIEIQKLSKKKAAKQPKGNPGDSSRSTDGETIFFIQTDGMKGQDAITVLSVVDYKFQKICVSAVKGVSFAEALKQDGRFKNIDRWEITNKEDESYPSLDSEAQHYPNAVFQASVKRTDGPKGKTKSLNGNNDNTHHQANVKQEAADPLSAQTVKKQKRDDQTDLGSFRKHTDGEIEIQEEEDRSDENEEAYITGVYRFSKPSENLSSKERWHEMHNCIKRNAKFTLVDRSERNNYQQEIHRIVREQFASRKNVARPAKLSKHISEIFPSVGRIVCGGVQGTCFLITEDMVITNEHVVDEIVKSQRVASDRVAHRSITIDFDYDEPGQSNASGVTEVARLDDPRNIRNEVLDYAFLALESKPEGKTPLGNKVKKHVPESGLVAIVGHLEGHEKLDDTCTIIPKANRQKEVRQRVQKEETKCLEYPRECNRNNNRVKCIHLYNPAKNIAENNDVITSYDTSAMFHGSSGSPVINLSGEIVAIHSCGFTLPESASATETSLLEYGFTFEAIINDLIERGLSDKVKSFFPFCEIEEMDQTE